MSLIEYKGFGGVRLAADMLGDENDPAVLLVPGIGQDRAAWREVADALVLSGRRVVNLGLRDEQPLAPHVEDLRLVLAQMGSVRTLTLNAFPEAAYREIIHSLG